LTAGRENITGADNEKHYSEIIKDREDAVILKGGCSSTVCRIWE